MCVERKETQDSQSDLEQIKWQEEDSQVSISEQSYGPEESVELDLVLDICVDGTELRIQKQIFPFTAS